MRKGIRLLSNVLYRACRVLFFATHGLVPRLLVLFFVLMPWVFAQSIRVPGPRQGRRTKTLPQKQEDTNRYYVRLENKTKSRVYYSTFWCTVDGEKHTEYRGWSLEPETVAMCSGPPGYRVMYLRYHTGGKYGKFIEMRLAGTDEGARKNSTLVVDWNGRGYLRLYTLAQYVEKKEYE